jgi:hypothetical protein
LKHPSSRIKKTLAILLVVLFVLSLTAVAVSARGGAGGGHGSGYGSDFGGYSIKEDGGYGPNEIYDTTYYEGNQNEDYAAVNQPDYAGDVYT